MKFLRIHAASLRLLCAAVAVCFAAHAQALDPGNTSGTESDQCTSTAQCKSTYGSKASACKNGASKAGVCMCGNLRCDSIAVAKTKTPTLLGRFDPSKDLLLAFYDTKPDLDDIHSQAGLGTILKNSKYAKVNYYALTGTVGRQYGVYIDPAEVMDKCFPGRWQHAYTSTERKAALDKVSALAFGILAKGGKVWVQEAGQSDFSADMIRALKQMDAADNTVSFDTRKTVIIVQHSAWNEEQATPSELAYVKAEADYRKIEDGNKSGNGTTGLNSDFQIPDWEKTQIDKAWARLLSHPTSKEVWTAARNFANSKLDVASHINQAIAYGGLDFSDTVEALYIFGKEQLHGIDDYLNEFLE
jgi:hypothetical protein